MPDDSNRSESEGRVINLPRPGEAYVPPPAARYADAARGAEDTVARAPEIPAAPPPTAQAAFRSEGIPAPSAAPVEYVESEPEYESGEEYGEYVERRNFAEVFSDWLQHLVDAARQNRDENAAYREAQVADKVARLNAETEREMGLLAQHNELRKAQLGARAAQTSAAAGGKGSGGTGAGHRSGPGPVNRGPAGGSGGGASGGRNSGGTGGGGSGSGGNGSGRGPGGAHNRQGDKHSEDRRKAPKEPSGGSGSRGRAEGPGGSLTGRQNGSGGPSGSHGSHGSGKPGSSGGPGKLEKPGKSGSSGGPGKLGSSGSSSGGGAGRGGSGGGERPRTWSAAAAERSRARQERSAARQNADLADRTKDRDSERAHRERVRDDDYARKQRRKERRQESGSRRVDLARELLEQWRRKSAPKPGEADPKSDEAGSKPDEASPKPDEPGPKPQGPGPKPEGPGPKPDTPGPKVGLGKGEDHGPVPGAGPETGPGPGPQAKGAGETGADDDYGAAATGDGWTQFLRKLHDTTQADKEKADNDGTGTGNGWTEFLGKVSDQHPPHGGPEAETVSPGNPDMASRRPAGSEDDDILDAEIVVDEQPGERTAASGPAPEAHFRRPDLLWPEEVPMPTGPPPARPWSSAESRRLTSRHETKVTFSEFLITMANIKINSARDAQNIENAVANLAVWAERWKRMCAELGGTHNLERKVVRLLDALAAMSESTAAHAGRLYKAVDTAAQKAAETAQGVAQIYQEDLEAMREGGLEEASAAVHHQ
ncbi:hypothetical protein ACFVT9_29460 [Kitasatospora cineracea]|uniref:hypothetical protein n=1 Tax=Kitasatospora cineracea TaxID=88074 RepID=UPI0036DDA8D2